MKIARIRLDGHPCWTELFDGQIYALEGDRFNRPVRGRHLGKLSDFHLLAPIESTNKIVALLANFLERGDRKGPGFYSKPLSAVIAHEELIVWPAVAPSINFEAELGVVIGRRAKDVPVSSARDYIMGYTVINDVTSMPLWDEDKFFSTRFKSYDTFCPTGPCIATGLDPSRLRMTARVNGVLKQDVKLDTMTFSVAETLAWISSAVTLEPGDIISMGTPPGYEDLAEGDIVECEIESIGILRNTVKRAVAR